MSAHRLGVYQSIPGGYPAREVEAEGAGKTDEVEQSALAASASPWLINESRINSGRATRPRFHNPRALASCVAVPCARRAVSAWRRRRPMMLPACVGKFFGEPRPAIRRRTSRGTRRRRRLAVNAW